jgi:proteasome lid subunit RPN8/RPN11
VAAAEGEAVTVTIVRAALAQAVAHLRAESPREGVGLLAGPAVFPLQPCPRDTDGDGDCGQRRCPVCARHADRWVPLANVSEFGRSRYETDPAELLAAHEALEADGRYPWVVVHSHPNTGTEPSRPDITYARNPKQLHLIVSLYGRSHMTLWRLDPEAAVQRGEDAVKIRWQVVDQHKRETWTTDLTRGVSQG